MKIISSNYVLPAAALALALAVASGCKSNAPAATDVSSDAGLTNALQSKLASDGGLANEPIQVSASNGTAILNGSVDSEAAKSLASNDAMQVPGVRGVMNNLTVQPHAVGSVQAVAPPPQAYGQRPSRDADRGGDRNRQSNNTAQNQPSYGPGTNPNQHPNQPVYTTPQPAAPVTRTVTVPAGTILAVRLTESLDSGTTQPGSAFHGSLASDLVADGLVAVPQGATVVGRVDDVKDATHFTGNASITAEVNYLRARGQSFTVSTDPFVQEGKGRGKNTIEKTGAGAAVGAILGGIFGGGKGAAIGAAAGAGAGAGSNAITRGQQVVIPSETILHFRLSSPFVVTVSSSAAPGYNNTNGSYNTNGGYNSNGDATLQHRPNQ